MLILTFIYVLIHNPVRDIATVLLCLLSYFKYISLLIDN